MTIDELDHGSYYTIRGAEHLTLVAYLCEGGVWVLEEENACLVVRFVIRGNELISSDMFGGERGPSGWTLADVITTAQADVEAGKPLPTWDATISTDHPFGDFSKPVVAVDDMPDVDMDVWGDVLK